MSDRRDNKPKRRCMMPVAPNAPEPPSRHPKLGQPSARWAYRDEAGALLGYVCRFEKADGGKSFRPLCLFEEKNSTTSWRWQSWPTPRPLYGLDRLAAHPDAPVLICEGEKSADSAQNLVPSHVAITSPGGSKGAAKADWSPLPGRDVVIWPDADESGVKYAELVAHLLPDVGVRSVAIITVPNDVASGWDAGDALKEGWKQSRAIALISGAALHHVKEQSSETETRNRKTPRQRDALLGSAESAELWRSPEGRAFATIPVNDHVEHWRLESISFKRWLAGRFYEETGGAPGGQQLTDALRVLDVRAVNQGACHVPMKRTGFGDDVLWLDLCDNDWRAIKITADGWEIVEQPPVKFVRNEIMSALPDPEAGGMIEELRSFINVDSGDYILVVSWLVAALWGRGSSFPVICLGGEQGSGKSTASRLLRSLVDPSIVETSSPPRDERDLIVAAGACHVLAFDNVSRIENWFSDAVCRLSTGAGFLTRKLHTDNDASWFQGSRPVIMNGIPSLTDRADLAERSLTVRLKRIDEESRQSEDTWWQEWEVVRPRVLGALCDALSGALRRHDGVRLAKMPRMASFAKLMAAAGPSLGWEDGDFEQAYSNNRARTSETAFEADPVAVAVRDWMTTERVGAAWEGTATELLAELNKTVSEDIRRSRFWPAKVNALGNAIDRAAPLLRQKQIHVQKRNTGAARLISIATTV
ncbi:MAG: ATP-binding protein [Hyphomicrobiales bacterium]|nr:ATP-binding protein [Hyphomicrobiales bacterium]